MGFPPPPTTPGQWAPSLKLWLHLFFLSKIALDLVDFATATRSFAATTFEGSHSVRLLENICDNRIMIWIFKHLPMHLRTVTKARLLCSFSFCSLLSFRYSDFVTLILLLSFCYSHFVTLILFTLIWSLLSNLLFPVIYLWRSLLYYVYSGIRREFGRLKLDNQSWIIIIIINK